jgi:membrane protein YdbS with pleckstrin-like domain
VEAPADAAPRGEESTVPVEKFRSKIDWWLALVLAFSIGAGTFGAFIAVAAGALMLPVAALIFFGAAVLPVWLLATTEYTLSDRELLVVSGPLRWKVPIAAISRVEGTRNPLSSPALSLDRIRIEYSRGKVIMISPQQKERFLAALQARRKAVT